MSQQPEGGLTPKLAGRRRRRLIQLGRVCKTMKKPLLLLLMTCLVVGIVGHLIIAFVITG
ncbi:hypothetical protein QE369_002314 [Agrobacterium larrymoorei]|uniref:Uncharacterized protein n=1 Tax=Agrobacterium larrymoorei TaxID=160699 RepID=A0AAJ2EV38_9HYPH|nr:hypothetical protein [Agrobacterium larrymoorei]MDR6102117.1 hypothetical protein [Agrobacterium larrymoorei]